MEAHYYNVLAEELGSDAIDGIMSLWGIAGYGRWCVLRNSIAMHGGMVDLSDDRQRARVAKRLQLKADALDDFIDELAHSGLVDATLWSTLKHVASSDISAQIDYRNQKSAAGKKGGSKGGGGEHPA